MINSLIHLFTTKEIILYEKHRQTLPLAKNAVNKKNYYFFDVALIWKYIPFKTSDKRKHRIMYLLLNIIQPKFILSMNWISPRESLYKVWTANHPLSSFVVVQHGCYVGGVVRDVPHKYTKCDVFLTWGTFFTNEFIKNNSQKNVLIKNFGNTIYNEFNRKEFTYKFSRSGKILLLPTALDFENLVYFNLLLKSLRERGFEVYVKAHLKQGVEKDRNGNLKYPRIEGVGTIQRELYSLLQQNDFDFIIADHSTSLLDAIFFKNKVLYFDPNNVTKGYRTNYSNYLVNLFEKDFKIFSKDNFYDLIHIDKQEELVVNMINKGNNVLKFF
jgi:hypothetical protein